MLFLTENYAALDILKNPRNYLEEGLGISQGEGATDVQPFILFGSSFPKDKEYTQVMLHFLTVTCQFITTFCAGVSKHQPD